MVQDTEHSPLRMFDMIAMDRSAVCFDHAGCLQVMGAVFHVPEFTATSSQSWNLSHELLALDLLSWHCQRGVATPALFCLGVHRLP